MVFISFPTSMTSEEESLLKKYSKLADKRRALHKANHPEPEVIATKDNKPVEAKDAKTVIERLKRMGQLPQIADKGRKSGFKRKLPAPGSSTPGTKAQSDFADESREVVSYEDDLFS